MKLWEISRDFLLANPAREFTYSSLAAELGTTPRAIGAAMYALGRRGFWSECSRVTFQKANKNV